MHVDIKTGKQVFDKRHPSSTPLFLSLAKSAKMSSTAMFTLSPLG